ncbi:MAG: ATP-dependent DNA helicase DinG [Gammaproteobacteria bacterium]|nr:ATP-dependent DNA helicase DinG [Gammaproteobacteria bacterium]
MLDEKIKETIQTAYSRLLEAKGFRARYCQKLMLAEIARTLGAIETDQEGNRVEGPHIAVLEAGTGTGKTIAYALAAIPLAKSLGKSLVISTATVALQEQIVFTDLPDIKRHAELDFSFALAKGRRRYLCLSKLDLVLQESASMNQSLAFYADEITELDDAASRILYQQMLDKLSRGEWDGDRDAWTDSIDDNVWNQVTTDHVQCTGRKCTNYRNCYFYKSRERMHKVDCIVTNHDLVLSDLVMGGGAVLPAPEDTIYIFDEGHHLPAKAINHFTHFTGLNASQTWLEQIHGALENLVNQLGSGVHLGVNLPRFEAATSGLVELVQQIRENLEELVAPGMPGSDRGGSDRGRYQNNNQYRFVGGRVDAAIQQIAAELFSRFAGLQGMLTELVEALDYRLEEETGPEKDILEEWYPLVSAMTARAEANALLWSDYMQEDDPELPPRARWVDLREGSGDLQVNSSPILVNQTLNDTLWNRCFGAVVTSATLSVGGNFDRFIMQSGIPRDNCFRALPSPFNFSRQGELRIPAMTSDPRDPVAHTQSVIETLPGLLAGTLGSLVLFTSWKQMFGVLDGVSEEFKALVLPQGELSKLEIIRTHKKRVDAGEQSIIFGLASFAEGIDLPGQYCDHVVIVKIPFSVPNDPVVATLGEWIDMKGGNAFREVSIPDAILRLVQACGRLLRTEQDEGVISLLDRRVITQRYGEIILNSLPPFRRVIEN